MVQELAPTRPDPTLEYDVTDAASGIPARVTILGGVIAVAQAGALRVSSNLSGDPQAPMGFWVPGTQPVPHGPDPLIIAELSLSQVGVYHPQSMAIARMHGVGNVQAQVAADARRGGHRFVWVSFTCIGAENMVLRYRVTLYRPR